MENKNEKERMAFWFMVAEYYGHKFTEGQVKMFAEDLMEYEMDDIKKSFKQYRTDTSKSFNGMPRPDSLIKYLEPQIDSDLMAVEIADRIYQAIGDYGWPNGERAREAIGEVAWAVIGGGSAWIRLCQSNDDRDKTNQIAQWRKSAKSKLEQIKKGHLVIPLEIPLNTAKKIAPGLKKIDFTEFGE